MRRTLLALSILLAATPAFACTADELQAKSIEFDTLVQAIVAKDPSQDLIWRQKQIDVARVAEVTTDLDQICTAYDGGIAEAKAATK